MGKKDLEETLKEKVAPLLEESMEKHLGVAIPQLESDITDQLKKPILDIYIPKDAKFKDAKKRFKKEFLRRELQLHLGNISHLAKSLGLDRRSIHRTIKDLEIDIDAVRTKPESKENHYRQAVGHALRQTLEPYKDILKDERMEKMYADIPTLSRNIAKSLPHHHLTWKEAEQAFEKEFLTTALKESEGNVAKAAEKIEIRVETLHRKIKKLHLK